MRTHGFITLALGLVVAAAPGLLARQAPVGPGVVRGTVVDSSAAVLPGVAVTVASPSGQTLGSTVTAASGEFAIDQLPVGSVVLTFHLDGFQDATKTVTAQAPGPNGDARIVQRLDLATLTESVTVRGDPPPPPPPPPPPSIVPVPVHDVVTACALGKAESLVPTFGVIRGSRKDPKQRLFAAGDEVMIEGGAASGLAVGRNFMVRRRFKTPLVEGRKLPVLGEHASGLVQVVSVGEQWSSAVVVYACDAMMAGDYLDVFEPEQTRLAEHAGQPEFDKATRVLFADEGLTVGVTNRMLVIGQGAHDGVRLGQRLTLFRRSAFGNQLLGDAVVVAAKTRSATIRIEQSWDAVFFGLNGDWAAPQRPGDQAALTR